MLGVEDEAQVVPWQAGCPVAASILPAPRRVIPSAPNHLQLHPGPPPPSAVDAWFLQNVTSDDGGWEPDTPAGVLEVVAWGTGLGQTALLAATPPRPGQGWLRWNSGLRDADGYSGIGLHGDPTMPYGPLEASAASIGVSGKPRVGVVSGHCHQAGGAAAGVVAHGAAVGAGAGRCRGPLPGQLLRWPVSATRARRAAVHLACGASGGLRPGRPQGRPASAGA
jgi:hypothetical protein